MAETISAEFAEPYFDLDVYDTSQIPKDLVDQKLILKHRILPLIQRGQILYVATSNPSNIEAIDAIRFNSKLMVEPVIVEHHKLEKVLGQHFAEESSFDFNDEEFDLDVRLDSPPLKKMKKKHLKAMKHRLLNILISY
jgi:type IV pilus assembly protein PilB